MPRAFPLILLILASCGFDRPKQASSVTVTLPPPKPLPAPGFSEAVIEAR